MKQLTKLYMVAGVLLTCCTAGFGQEKKPARFVSPFDFPLTLSGNFGELRTNHFHGGLDFRTGGVVGKPVRALADGYISRIRVTNGSGYMLYLHYNNGYTAINRHLDSFLSPIAERMSELQYATESWEADIRPEPHEYPVKAGQLIGRGGNTGYSFGPHLHMDLLENETGDYVDPLPFFAHRLKDTRPPQAESILLMPRPGRGMVEGGQDKKLFRPGEERPIEVWGLVGTGIRAFDYMDGVNNRFGVYRMTLSVDGSEVFRSTVDRFSEEESRMINSWTYRGDYMKAFVEPGNTLRMLQASGPHRGWIEVSEERDYHCVYVLTDYFGNSATYRFTLRGRKQPISPPASKEKYRFAWDKTNYLQEPGLGLVVPRGALYDDVQLRYRVQADSNAIAWTYRLNDEPISLHTAAELRIGLRRMPVADSTKYYIARVGRAGKKTPVGGTYADGGMKASVRELATYTVAVDTLSPAVVAVGKAQWARNGKIVCRLKDAESGIASCRGTIDGRFALFGRPNLMRPYWECTLDPRRMKKGGKHTLELTVTDRCGNETVLREEFVW